MQCCDEASHAAKHALDLVMAAFMQRHTSTPLAQQYQFAGQRGDVFGSEVKATLEGGDGIAGDGRISFNDIGLWHLGLSVHELLRPAAIVGQQ